MDEIVNKDQNDVNHDQNNDNIQTNENGNQHDDVQNDECDIEAVKERNDSNESLKLNKEDDIDELVKKYDGKVLPDHLRGKLWQVYLGIAEEININLPEIFDLTNQKVIRSDCQKLVQKLSLDQAEAFRIQSDLEQILTALCKNHNITYHTENSWLDIMRILLPLKLSKIELFNIFESIVIYFVPKYWEFDKTKDEFATNNQASYLFRLLLLYFDPELCSFLDTKKITPDMYALSWFKSLFASHSSIKIIQALWDIYLQKEEPLMIFFISLVMVINTKEQLFEMKESPKEEIVKFINAIPNDLDLEDVEDLYELIQNFYISHTPKSISELNNLIFQSVKANVDDDEDEEFSNDNYTLKNKITDLSQILCLPISVRSMLPSDSTLSQFRFFVVDCRPPEHYNNGHLTTAFHLDCSLMLQEPAKFNSAAQALLISQKQAINAGSLAGGRHLCFLGSGREEEDRYLNMVVAYFLQKKQEYVSIANGGYEQLHNFLSENNLMNMYMTEHNRRYCLPCSKLDSIRSLSSSDSTSKLADKNSSTSKLPSSSSIFNFSSSITSTLNSLNRNISVMNKPAVDNSFKKNSNTSLNSNTNSSTAASETNDSSLFDKFTSTFKSKSQGIKDKLADIISNPTNSGPVKKHVSSTDLGKRYNPRNFSIADDEEEGESENDLEIDVDAWCKQNKALGTFSCKELKGENSCYPSFLVLTESHLYILREIPHNKGYAKIVAKRPLERLLQITSKKKRPDIIRFRYGQPGERNEDSNIMITDQLLIPKTTDAIELIKIQISNNSLSAENSSA